MQANLDMGVYGMWELTRFYRPFVDLMTNKYVAN
jgi:hypothetical protein